jgi:broad specificity phosphatase PhoE
MVSGDNRQGLIPLAEGSKHMKFANLFTLILEIKKEEGQDAVVEFVDLFKGFPDKGGFPKSSGPIVGGSVSVYVDNVMHLNLEPIKRGIMSAFGPNDTFNGICTIGRHGNALHNKPVSLEGHSKRKDSSLTLAGILQAKIAGTTLGKHFEGKNVMLLSSFLGRTQLTGALMLQYAGGKIGKNMLQFIEYKKYESYYRFLETGFDLNRFMDFSPFNDPNYESFAPVEMLEEIRKEANRFKAEVFDKTGGGSLFYSRQSRKRHLRKRLTHKSKTYKTTKKR